MTEKPVALPSWALRAANEIYDTLNYKSHAGNEVFRIARIIRDADTAKAGVALPSSPAPEPKMVLYCEEHEIALNADGTCAQCRDKEGKPFILDMQSTYFDHPSAASSPAHETLCMCGLCETRRNLGESVPSTPSPIAEFTAKRKARIVTPERARLAAERLINSHFRNAGRDHARMSIPVNLDDDDVVINDFISQNSGVPSTPVETPCPTFCPHGIAPDQRCMNCGPGEATPVETASPMQRCEKWLQKIAEKNPAGISDQYVNAFREGYQFAFNDAQLELTQVREELRQERSIKEAEKKILLTEIETSTRLRSELQAAELNLWKANEQVDAVLECAREVDAELGKAEAENKRLRASLQKIFDLEPIDQLLSPAQYAKTVDKIADAALHSSTSTEEENHG